MIRCAPAALLVLMLTSTFSVLAQDVRYRRDKLQDTLPFSHEEAAGLMAIGETTLTGQASMTIKRSRFQIVPGTTLYARDQQVLLFPMTKFLKAWVQRHAAQGLRYGAFNLQPELDTVAARSITDKEGRFSFRGLKPGQYLLWVKIPYEVEGLIEQQTGEWQTTTFTAFNIVTAAVREPVTRNLTQVRELENDVIHVVDIPAERRLVELGEIQGERAKPK